MRLFLANLIVVSRLEKFSIKLSVTRPLYRVLKPVWVGASDISDRRSNRTQCVSLDLGIKSLLHSCYLGAWTTSCGIISEVVRHVVQLETRKFSHSEMAGIAIANLRQKVMVRRISRPYSHVALNAGVPVAGMA